MSQCRSSRGGWSPQLNAERRPMSNWMRSRKTCSFTRARARASVYCALPSCFHQPINNTQLKQQRNNWPRRGHGDTGKKMKSLYAMVSSHTHARTHARTRTHAHTHTRTHTRTHARTHAHKQTDTMHLKTLADLSRKGPVPIQAEPPNYYRPLHNI